MEINSKEYWNKRFETDWNDFGGDKQTAFFAHILCDMLPMDLIRESMAKNYSICDMGCAMGQGIPIYSRKFNTNVDGMDFSEEAIEQNRRNYPESKFWTGNLLSLEKAPKYDITICSNVLEHFRTPWKVLRNLASMTERYIILLMPYREKLHIEEHEYHFSEDVIPISMSEFTLDYVRTVDGEEIQDTYYPDQQILLIYKKNSNDIQMLSELSCGIVDAEIRRLQKQFKNEEENYQVEVENWKSKVVDLEEVLRQSENNCQEIDYQKRKVLEGKVNRISELEEEIAKANNLLKNKEEEITKYKETISEISLLNEKKQEEFERTSKLLAEQSRESLLKGEAILKARANCLRINNKLSYKFLCLIIRFCHQFICGSWTEKKKFLHICKSFLKREQDTFSRNDGYNMIMNIANVLIFPEKEKAISGTDNYKEKQTEKKQKEIILPESLSENTKNILGMKYSKPDIIFFSVIDFDFRHQRPQHFAERFADNGHRVFYVNANFINKESVSEKKDKLNIINFHNKDCNAIYYASESVGFDEWILNKMRALIREYAIRDAIIVLNYPNWIHVSEKLRSEFGFSITVDYMDDFTGFLNTTTTELADNCVRMLKNSNLVIASSQFLYEIACQYTDKIKIVRNGTEVEHFYQALKIEEEKKNKKRPVIGYYGAVSHWFDWEKICYIAEKLQEIDIVIVGEITAHKDKLQQYKNIKLLGEKPYQELPSYLATFDVCLIPFDTSTDLIKATNPVKFYEYLSAGKKVVATEIPELAPYKNKYVYMSNDNEEFLKYIKLCLDKKDELETEQNCIEFARENDWQNRYKAFSSACLCSVPKVSIIVLTYNNLELNKWCINSILNKTAYPNYELIILDNCSTDGTREYLNELRKENIANVKVILNENNSGFAGGNNIAIGEASGEFIMLLNNDTIVTRGWLTNAVKHMQQDQKCGMCGAVTNSIGNEAMIAVNYRNLHELDCFSYLYTSQHNNEVYKDVDRLAMFCTLIRKEIIDKYGMLDKNYQVGMFEDDDYARVVESAGYSFYVVEDVFVHHVNNASFKKLDSKKYKEVFERNREYFEKKWNVKWKMPKYREGVVADINVGMMVEPIE